MKIFKGEIWIKRRIIFIFLFSILIPSLIIWFLSWNSFSKRREALRRVFESQLWISGETAAKSIESALQEYEQSILRPENFIPLHNLDDRLHELDKNSVLSTQKVFLLDADFRLILPRSGSSHAPFIRLEESMSGSPFYSLFQRAEYLEFEKKQYTQAAELYHQCSLATSVKQLQAFALERCGRCLSAAKSYEEASRIYLELLNNYGSLKNRVGHPYELIIPVRLYESAKNRTVERKILKILIDSLRKLRNGEWPLNNSTYEYYSRIICDFLKEELSEKKYPELYDSYKIVLESTSSYAEELEFRKLLIENVIPIMKDRVYYSRFTDESQRSRLPVVCDGSQFLVSYTRLRDVSSNQFFYAGFCWDLDYIKNQKLPEVTNNLIQTSGIKVRLIDENNLNQEYDQGNLVPKDSLSVTLHQFPLPWRFIVTQTYLENLKSTTLKENFFHGILLVVIVGLICIGAFLIARDISRESEAAKHKSEFVHNISHELKTPLTLIRLYGETLRDKRILSEENRQEAYEIITKESERLSHMINNVLDFSRIEMGKKEFHFKKGNLAKIIKETLDSYRYHLEKKGFCIHEEIETDLPPMDFDREAITSVLINLLSNAMKFSLEKKEVTVRLIKYDDSAVLQVEDKGIGISQKEADKIFQRFYRSENNVVSESIGSGLGLPIVQHIAEAHKGRVGVESEPGKGSVFSVFFPIIRTNEANK
jgi:signal transduction histidine kinase